MTTIIETTNITPSESLNNFILLRSDDLAEIDDEILFIEFNLSSVNEDYLCTMVLVSTTSKNFIVTKQADRIHTAVAEVLNYAELNLRRRKLDSGSSKPNKIVDLRCFADEDESSFDFSMN